MKKSVSLILAAAFLAFSLTVPALAADPVVRYLEGKGVLTAAEAEALRNELAAEAREPAPSLRLGNNLRLDGRIYAGYLDREGRAATFEIPDGALRFTWGLADNIDVVTRWRYNNAQDNNLDQMYVRFKRLLPFDETSHLSIGKFKMDVGEEHKTDNRVGNWPGLISNSVVNMAATDWGLALSGSMVPGTLGYVLTVSNANNGDVVDNNYKKAWSAKVHYRPVRPLYLSAGYYTTDRMDDATAALSIAGNRRTLAGVNDWRRSAWKLVSRWEPNRAARLAAAWGQFSDDALAPAGIDNIDGKFYYLEARYSFVPRFYAAARHSSVKLDDNALATLGGFNNCNEAVRTSFGLGYVINRNVTLKTEYTSNSGRRPGQPNLSADQFALGAALTF